MIVVVGRPGLSAAAPRGSGDTALSGLAARVAVRCAAAGARVELVGSVGDDAEGDLVAVELGRAGVGHAALLRDPAARTPLVGADGVALERGREPRLEAADVELGLRYVPDCRVLVLAEPLAEDAIAVARDAAAFHGAALVALIAPGQDPGQLGLAEATLLEVPHLEDSSGADEEGSVDDGGGEVPDTTASVAFEALVARYAAALDAGEEPAAAFAAAVRASGWEPGGRG